MRKKVVGLSKALWIESVKRLPYVLALLVIIILVQGFLTGAKVAENVEISKQNSEDNSVLLDRIASLSADNKRLSEDNQSIAKQNRAYTRCIADIFAQYTQDFMPVVIKDLDSCTTASQSAETDATSTGGTTPSSRPTKKPSSNTKASSPATKPSNSEQPPASEPEPKLLDCKVDLLGLHIGCP